MSKSEGKPARFDDWAAWEYRRTGGFTALVVLVSIGDLSVTPLRSTWFHVVGDELDWQGVEGLLAGSGAQWDGVLFAPLSDDDGGPVEDIRARYELQMLTERLIGDRMVLNEHHFFDRRGRRLKIEEAAS